MSEFAVAAAEIADELTTAAGGQGRWTSDTLVMGERADDGGVVHAAAGHDLYGGAAGIAWFLAHHARHLSSEQQEAAARSAFIDALEASGTMIRDGQLGLYTGAAGIALAAGESAVALGDDALGDAATHCIEQVAARACAIRVGETDLIGGKAGIIVALLSFAGSRRDVSGKLTPAIRELAEQLVEDAYEGWWGAAWPGGTDPGLCGLGHGCSGIGWALSEAGLHLGDDRVRDAGQAALRYEAGMFDSVRASWPDLRDTGRGKAPGWMDAWCHGAIGIGAARWLMWEHRRDPLLLGQATAAMGAARRCVIAAGRAGPGQAIDVTLCHGLAGSVELMLLAYEVTGRVEHLMAARKAGRLILRLKDEAGTLAGTWAMGLPGGRDVPGLLLGRAGIGAMFLRLHDPQAIPSPMLAGLSRRRAGLAAVPHAVPFGVADSGQAVGMIQEPRDGIVLHQGEKRVGNGIDRLDAYRAFTT